MIEKKLTIDDLFSDTGTFDESEVVSAISPFVAIHKESKEIYFKDTNLNAEQKILVYALAKKLLKHKSLIEVELITAPEISQKTGIKKGTVDPTFKTLRDKGLLLGKVKYEVPLYKIHEIIDRVKGKKQK